jgi:Ca2+-binding RTX toxin-like protein
VIAALGGNDSIILDGAANTVICLGAGNDSTYSFNLLGGPGPVSIRGGAGDDFIVGTRGNDALNGVDGNDFINGLGGYDVARGGLGYDRGLNNEVSFEIEA